MAGALGSDRTSIQGRGCGSLAVACPLPRAHRALKQRFQKTDLVECRCQGSLGLVGRLVGSKPRVRTAETFLPTALWTCTVGLVAVSSQGLPIQCWWAENSTFWQNEKYWFKEGRVTPTRLRRRSPERAGGA